MKKESNFSLTNIKFLILFAKPFYKECLISAFFILSATSSMLYIGHIVHGISELIGNGESINILLLIKRIKYVFIVKIKNNISI